MLQQPRYVVLISLLFLPLAGCNMVTKEELAVHTRQLSSLESDLRSTNSRVKDLSEISRDEDQRLRAAVSDEAKDRKATDQQLSDAIAQTRAGHDRFRRVIEGWLQAEKELLVSLVEIDQAIEELKKKGVITEKEIQASKAARLEAEVWVKRLDSIKAQLDALSGSRTPSDSGADR